MEKSWKVPVLQSPHPFLAAKRDVGLGSLIEQNPAIDVHIDALFALAIFSSGSAESAQAMVIGAFENLCVEGDQRPDKWSHPWRTLADHIHSAELSRLHRPDGHHSPFDGVALTRIQREGLALVATAQDYSTAAGILELPESEVLSELRSALAGIHAALAKP